MLNCPLGSGLILFTLELTVLNKIALECVSIKGHWNATRDAAKEELHQHQRFCIEKLITQNNLALIDLSFFLRLMLILFVHSKVRNKTRSTKHLSRCHRTCWSWTLCGWVDAPLRTLDQGFISQPETGYRRPPVPVYRTG